MNELNPALTAAEWAEFLAGAQEDAIDEAERTMKLNRLRRVMVDAALTARRFHAAAALSLHRQRFGFTWEDVDRLRAVAAGLEANTERHGAAPGAREEVTWAKELADRIAALLPPHTA